MVDVHSLHTRFREAKRNRAGSESFPRELIELAVDYAREERAAGTRWRIISERVGISRTTLRNWVIREEQNRPERAGFEALTVIEKPPVEPVHLGSEVTLSSPNGFTVTGCSLSEIAKLLQVLG